MLNIIGAIVSGFIVGVLARWIYPEPLYLGFWKTVLLGIGGSLAAGLITTRGRPGVNRAGCIASVLGALALIYLYHWLA